jgi:hypothetical protein
VEGDYRMDELDCRGCSVKKYCGTAVGEIKLCHSVHPEYWEKKDEEKRIVDNYFKKVDAFIAEEEEQEDLVLKEIFEDMQADYNDA